MITFDVEKIGGMLDDIERYLNDLKEMNVKEENDLTGKERFCAVSMIAFSIMNRCIDLSNEIISTCKFGIPSSYRDLFEYLYRENVIDKAVRDKMITLVYYRNLIAHEYHEFNEKEILKFVNEVGISERFLEHIRDFIKAENKNSNEK